MNRYTLEIPDNTRRICSYKEKHAGYNDERHARNGLYNNKHFTRFWRSALCVFVDLAIVASSVGLFMFWHHGIERPAQGIMIVGAAAEHETDRESVSQTETDLQPVSVEQPKPGDFSQTFPNYDTGVGALHSYQSDTLRIAITKTESNGTVYFVADVWVRNIDEFKTAFAKDQYGQGINDGPTAIARNNRAILAMTGDYYSARAKGVVVRNGVLYRNTAYSDVGVLYDDGVFETSTKQEFDINSAVERGVRHAWSFGPQLLIDGKPVTKMSDEYAWAIQGANPRAGIGYYEAGHYCLVVADGRQRGYSIGATLQEFSRFFYDLGCKAAYNLDGGQTAKMLFDGEAVNNAYRGGREVSDIIYFGGR